MSTPNSDRKARFLQAFQSTGVLKYACRRSRVAKATVYDWQITDSRFCIEFYRALVNAQSIKVAALFRLLRMRLNVEDRQYSPYARYDRWRAIQGLKDPELKQAAETCVEFANASWKMGNLLDSLGYADAAKVYYNLSVEARAVILEEGDEGEITTPP